MFCGSIGVSWPMAIARSASPCFSASAASMTASDPPTLWLVMQAFEPFSRLRMPTWHSTLFGSVRSSHIGFTDSASFAPKAWRSPPVSLISGK